MSHFTAKMTFALAALLLLAACGDWTAGSPDADGAVFSRSYRYYYVMDCRFDGIGLFDCNLAAPISPAYTASLRIDSDDLATLSLDGNYSYYYTTHEYTSGHDDYGSYYYFYDNGWELTFYKDGSELIFWDTDENTATVYLNDLDYE